jgi:NTE family protein
MPNKKEKTIGLALGSGGARGFAHIGVIKALEGADIKIGSLSGSSIGSLVAAYYALNKEIDGLIEDALKLLDSNIFRFLETGLKAGLLSQNKSIKALGLIFNDNKFSDVTIPLKLLATDLLNGEANVMEKGRLDLAVQASCAVPLVFNSVKKDNKRLVDGGLSEPVPVDVLKKEKIDAIVAVNLYHENEFVDKKFNLATVALRSNKILLHQLSREKCKEADITINVDLSKQLISSGFKHIFSKKQAMEAIEIGKEATKKIIPKIKKILG